MGNTLIRFLCGSCYKPSSSPHDSQSIGHHGVTPATVGVSALAQDLLNFDVTSQVTQIYPLSSSSRSAAIHRQLKHPPTIGHIYPQVPDGLSQHVVSSKKAQANWYAHFWVFRYISPEIFLILISIIEINIGTKNYWRHGEKPNHHQEQQKRQPGLWSKH